MFDIEEARKELAASRSSVLKQYTIAGERRDRGKANEGKKKMYERQVASMNERIERYTETANHLKDIYKNIQSYNQKHQERVQNILDLAIIEAGSLVPDADSEGIHLNYSKDNRVTVVNKTEQNINLREGGGYRSILGALLRYACLKAQPDALPLLIFDEYFFTLSDTTTDAIHPILEAMKRDVAILFIEQRRNAMNGLVDYEYTFKKDLLKNTSVTRTL